MHPIPEHPLLWFDTTSGMEGGSIFRLLYSDADDHSANTSHADFPLHLEWFVQESIPHLPSFTILFEIQAIILLASFTVNICLLIRICSTSLFHRNLKLIYKIYLVEYFLFVAAQLILILHHIDRIPEIVSKFEEKILYVCINIKLFRLWSSCLLSFSCLLERIWASWNVMEYEQIKTAYLGIAISLVRAFVSAFLSYAVVVMNLSYSWSRGVVLFIVAISVVTLVLLNWKNSARLRRMNSPDFSRFYTLSMRYQLMENQRVFMIIRTLVFIACVNISLTVIGLSTASHVVYDSEIQPYIVLLLEYQISATPIIVAVMLRFLAHRHFARTVVDKTAGLSRAPSRYNTPTRSHAIDEETEIYFTHLDKMWQ